MTVHFVPGDPNRSPYSVQQARWRNHKIIAYGSGNNLIIHTITDGDRSSLQTVYMDKDPASVCINGRNGLICVSCGTDFLILKPLNEYMSVPKWTEVAKVANGSARINCLKWASAEDELAVGCDSGLTLYHVYIEYGELKYAERWSKAHPSPVQGLDITADASKIVTYNSSNYDSFAKVWMRINYGDTNSLFDLVYSDHERDKWLLDFRWREKSRITKENNDDLLLSMVNIKNIRSFMPTSASEDNDILYTVTNDLVLNVWATFDFSGHSHLKRWALLDLTKDLKSEYMTSLIIDNSYLQDSLIPELQNANEETEFTKFFQGRDLSNLDLLLVQGRTDSVLYAILNVNSDPPNNILFEKVSLFPTFKICLPDYASIANPQERVNQKEHFAPIYCDSVLNSEDSKSLSFLVHDRVKDTLRSVDISFGPLTESSEPVRLDLKEKFQGHPKSIKKLVTSSTSHKGNVMLSILSFPQYNYIWEPLPLHQQTYMSVAKRFHLDVTRDPEEDLHNQGIADAILINDIAPAKGHLRHHLAVVVEKGGYISVWDCDGATMDDQRVKLQTRLEITDESGHRVTIAPQALLSKEISDKSFIALSAFDAYTIKAWKITINDRAIECVPVKVDKLPGEYTGKTKISTVDTFLERDLSVIDEKGVFRTINVDFCEKTNKVIWNESCLIHTNIENPSFINCASLINKLAIVDESGSKLSIWDCKQHVLEYEEVFPVENGPVRDLDWNFIGSTGSTANALLLVGFPRFVQLYAQLRYDYTNDVPTFAVLKKIDISDYTSHEIGDLIWIDQDYLVIGSGNQFFIDDKWVNLGSDDSGASGSITSTIRQLMVGYKSASKNYLISDLVRILNGPLPVYHPQFLIQALLMNEVKLVEEVLVKLLKVLRSDEEPTWNLNLNLLGIVLQSEEKHVLRRRLSIFGGLSNSDVEVFANFNSSVAELLVEKLTKVSLPLLTRHQQITLSNVITIVNRLSQYKHSLDENGMKFFCGFDLFQSSLKQHKLSMRDISWALHSDQKEMIFGMVDTFYNHRLTWDIIKKIGLAYWIDKQRLTTLIETIARNEFGDSRDPSGRVSVLYLAIKKKQILVGLWRTVSHTEKEKVLKFLNNDFTESRWQSAAQKNAFVLLSKHRYMDAAYFFLLAGKVKDCCITLCNKVNDIELALVVAKVNSDKEAMMHIIELFILPKALSRGDRWMTSWVFWEMKLKEISIQALVKSPIGVVQQNREVFSENFQRLLDKVTLDAKSKSFLRDDPVLAVLYAKLRSSKLNYLKGAEAVQPEEEFQFVVKVSTIYSRMGCDYLALLLLRRWKFLDYSTKVQKTKQEVEGKNIFEEFAAPLVESNGVKESTPTTFEEPDMSSFNFGF